MVVIGAGQAGLSAAHHLQRRGRSFVVLDAEDGPGGAWRHRWPSLLMATVNGIFDLPGLPQDPPDPAEPSRVAVPRYFAEYERLTGLAVRRPVTVTSVEAVDEDPAGRLLVRTTAGGWSARAVINATGTWNNPVLPTYPGRATFAGRQLHAREYGSAEEFAGQRVAVVGGGITAVQLLEEVSRVATTHWYTRREPVFRDGGFDPQVEGREIIARVTADVEAGRPTGSVVSYTGLFWTPYAVAARDRGALQRRPMFSEVRPEGVVEADGTLTPLDAVLWATGFKPSLGHLEPMGLRDPGGGMRMAGTQVAREPRVHLVGFGPSQSTVGANRAGRAAVVGVSRLLAAA
ncbi:NAD(P)/FAD-dependent oxidoreductase [Streptomyces sp. NP160]|nr:NAD(P)/FAD-dependent oxidoreductase [Streptomyces sp. NP160]